ncbi:MAG: putative Ig domain-containing protein [bacterium]
MKPQKSRLRTLTAFTLFLALTHIGQGFAENLNPPGDGNLIVTGINLESSTRLRRFYYEFVFTIDVKNTGNALENVVATVISKTSRVAVIDSEIVLGDVPSGVSTSTDTFTVRAPRWLFSRLYPKRLLFEFSANEVDDNRPPVADAGPDQAVEVGAVVALDGAASSDPEGQELAYVWSLVAPQNSNAMLSSVADPAPTFVADVAGVFTATLTVSDGELSSGPDSVAVTVNAVNTPPQLAPVPNGAVNVGATFNVTLLGTDAEEGQLVYSLDQFPAGMMIDPLSGQVSWVPTAAQLGGNPVVVRVTDAGGLFATQSFTVQVNELQNLPPIAIAGPDRTVDVGTIVMLDGTSSNDAEGAPLSYAWQLETPDGSAAVLSDSSLASPSFLADVAGTYNLTLIVNDGELDSAPDGVNVTAQAVNTAPTLSAVEDGVVMVGELLSILLVGNDPEGGALIYSLDLAPAGMSVDPSSGLIAWTPTAAQVGANPVTARVTDEDGLFATQSFTVQVDELPNETPSANAGADQVVDVDTLVILDGSASVDPDDGPQPMSFNWMLEVPPGSGSALTDATVMAPSFIPDLPGTYTATLVVDDGVEVSAPDTVVVTATAINIAPSFEPIDDQAAAAGTLFALSVSATDPDVGDALLFSLLEGPSGMVIDVGTGEITWTPDGTQAGSNVVTLQVTDAGGLTDTVSFLVFVEAPNAAPVAVDDAFSTPVTDQLFVVAPGVLQNDTDPDGDALMASLVQSNTNGDVLLNADGSFSFLPASPLRDIVSSVVSGDLLQLVGQEISVASSSRSGGPVFNAFDGDLSTTWYSAFGDSVAFGASPFIEVSFRQDVSISEVQVFGARVINSGNTAIREGVVQIFNADDQEIFNSGPVTFPEPNWDAVIPVPDLNGARRIRLTPTIDGNSAVRLAELRVLGSAVTNYFKQRSDIELTQHARFSVSASSTIQPNPVLPGSVRNGADGGFRSNWQHDASSDDGTPEYRLTFPDQTVTVNELQFFAPRNSTNQINTSLSFANVEITLRDTADSILWSSGLLDASMDQNVTVPSITGVRDVVVEGSGSTSDAGFSEIKVFGDGLVWPLLPYEQWGWDNFQDTVFASQGSFSTPLVVDLDQDGSAEVIFAVGEGSLPLFNGPANIVVLNGEDGSEQGAVLDADLRVNAMQSFAVGDIDEDGLPEIVAAANVVGGVWRLVAFEHDLTLKWFSDDLELINWGGITIANIDGAGRPEVLVGRQVLDADGAILWTGAQSAASARGVPMVTDLDLDGQMEVVVSGDVYAPDGQHLWDIAGTDSNLVATGNFDADPFGELVAVVGSLLRVYEHDGTIKWEALLHDQGGGPPTVADFDGDGRPEVGVAAGLFYRAFDSDGLDMWKSERTTDGSRGTTSTVFDFDGDGTVEVVVRDEQFLRILRGTDGETLFRIIAGSATASEGTAVADIDGDDQAEILVPTNAYNGSGIDPRTGMLVLAGLDENWVRTRPVWNQNDYSITGVNIDGTIPAQPVPNWLVPGLNNYRLNAFRPDDPGSRESFTYIASDGELDSNEATVFLDVRPVNTAPVFAAAPDTTATTNVEYLYLPQIVDAEFDAVMFALVDGPAGMTVDSTTGLTRWIPSTADIGDVSVTLRVEDDRGLATFQIFTLTVGEPVIVPDVVGLAEAAAAATLQAADLSVGNITREAHPTIPSGSVIFQNPVAGSTAEFGGAVALVVSTGPGSSDFDVDGDGFTENQGDCNDNDAAINPNAIDIPGDGIDQDCDGQDAQLPFAQLFVEPSAATLFVGQSITLTALGVFEDQSSQDVSATAHWSTGSNVFSATAPGSFIVTAASGGQTDTSTIEVLAVDASDSTPPVAVISNPASGDSITDRVSVFGTAVDENFVGYTLSYAAAGSNDFVLINESDAPADGALLGQFDPTLLINGQYTLRLEVYDAGANVSRTEATVLVEEDLKVGSFSLSFTDLAIPMSGIPITVTRTYDSRDRSVGDFGYGWRLDVNTLRLSSNRVLGTAWQVVDAGLVNVALVEDDRHIVSLTLPDGRVEKFQMVVSPDSAGFSFGGPVQVSFLPLPGTLGSLESLENNFVLVIGSQPGVVELVDDTSLNTYDPQRFRYTTANGTQIVLDKRSGVESVTEPSGNTLTFGPGGITHSAGRSVVFARDLTGRITQITDPVGNTHNYTYDANGDLVQYRDTAGFETEYAYNRNHGLIRITDPLDRVVSRTEYDDNGRIVSITNADGRQISFSRDLDGRQEVIADANGNTTFITYDDTGNVLQSVDPLGGVTNNTYDANGNQLTSTNPLGETTTRTFDARNNLLSETNPAGETTSLVYDINDNVTQVTDPLGRVTQFEYDSANRLIRRINALGVVEEIRDYDSVGNLISRTDARGETTAYEYDAFGNPSAVIDALGNRSTTAYNANGAVISETDARGTTVVTVVDERGLYTAKTDPLDNTSTFVFNEAGVLTGSADALGHTTSLEVDAAGKDLSFTDALGNTTAKAYDIVGNLIGITDAAGNTVSYEYDPLSRRIRTVNPDTGAATVEYDAVGRVVRQVDARGNETTFEYDLAGRNIRRTDALGHSTEFDYDAAGNLVRQTDALGQIFQFEYDALNRQTRTTFPDGTSQLTAYDASGNVLSETDALGRVTSYTYDAVGNLVSVTQPGGATTTFVYDAANNVVSQTDALGRTTSFAYDDNGRRISKTYPDGTTEWVTYDVAGRVDAVTDPNGATTQNDLDGNGRITLKTFGDGSTENYTYTPTGQIATVTNSSGTTRFGYDLLDRLQRVTYPDGSVVSYTFDLAGNRTSVTSGVLSGPGQTTSYTFDALNRIASVIEPDGETTSYGYDAIGNLATKTHPNGVVSTFTYDSLSRLSNLRHERSGVVIAQYAYTVNAVGDRTRVDHADGSRVEYAYDERRQLTRETHYDVLNVAVFEQTYTYDAVGNRTSQIDLAGNTVVYSYNDNDQLTRAGTTDYNYDANGNLIAKHDGAGVTTYTFDAENQLTQVSTPAQGITYTYDGVGTRLTRSVSALTTNFLVDPQNATSVSQVLVDYDNSGTRLADYTFGYELLSRNRGGTQQRLHRDGSLNVRVLTNDAGVATDQLAYAAFGNVIERTGTSDNPYQFATERYGVEESLVYLRARYYDPETGRFISRDPFEGVLRDPVSLHRYLYAHANPIVNRDPTGKFTVGISLAEVGVVSTISAGISLIASGVAGETYEVAFAKALLSAGLGAIGAPAGAFVGSITSVITSQVTRRFAASFAVIASKATVDTVFGVWGLVGGRSIDNQNTEVSVGEFWTVFGINFIAHTATFGLLPTGAVQGVVDDVLPIGQTRPILEEGLNSAQAKRLWGEFKESGETDFLAWLPRLRGGTARVDRARNLAPQIAAVRRAADEFLEEAGRSSVNSAPAELPSLVTALTEATKGAANAIFVPLAR